MKLIRNLADAFMGLALRMVFGALMFGIFMVLLACLVEMELWKRRPKRKIAP